MVYSLLHRQMYLLEKQKGDFYEGRTKFLYYR